MLCLWSIRNGFVYNLIINIIAQIRWNILNHKRFGYLTIFNLIQIESYSFAFSSKSFFFFPFGKLFSQFTWSKQKWLFWRAGFYPANQNKLKSFHKSLIGWKKAGPPKKPLLFWSCKQAKYYLWLAGKNPRQAGPDWNDHVNRLNIYVAKKLQPFERSKTCPLPRHNLSLKFALYFKQSY